MALVSKRTLYQNRNLAPLGSHDLAACLNDVSQIQQVGFGVSEPAFGHISRLNEIAPQKQLQPPGLVLDVSESEGALLAPGHQASGDGDFLSFEVLEIVNNCFRKMSPTTTGRVWVQAQRT